LVADREQRSRLQQSQSRPASAEASYINQAAVQGGSVVLVNLILIVIGFGAIKITITITSTMRESRRVLAGPLYQKRGARGDSSPSGAGCYVQSRKCVRTESWRTDL